MKIHEYQAKKILRDFGVAIPMGFLATTPPEAREAAEKIGGEIFVLKAQVHAGGRGKGGGIKIAKSLDDVEEIAKQMLGMKLITPQTGSEGRIVRKIYVEEGLKIKKEFYLGMILDRESKKLVLMASSEGGVEIEEVAARSPEKIIKEYIDINVGIQDFNLRKLCYFLGFQEKNLFLQFSNFATGIYNAFITKDSSLVEINPLILTEDEKILALDAKMNFDDNSLFRHPEIVELRDFDEEEPMEVEASKYDLSYIKLDGNIGNLVNGAGLAMATMDIIKYYGGRPANFLDVGGSASEEKVSAAFRIILKDKVDAILVNIFGGIMKCDIIASGIVAACRETGLKIPLVVRLQGTNVDIGKKILAESGLPIISADTMEDAGKMVVKAAKGEINN